MKKYLDKFIYIITGLILCLMMIDIVIQVIYRYLLNNPLPWPEEAAGIMLVWLSYLGIYLALKEKRHIGVELLVKRLPENIRFNVKIISKIIVIIFLVVVVQQGYKFAWRYIDKQMIYTGVPYGYVYAAFPVSGLLLLLQSIIDIAEQFKNRKEN